MSSTSTSCEVASTRESSVMSASSGTSAAESTTTTSKKRPRPRVLPAQHRVQLSALHAFLAPLNVWSLLNSTNPAMPREEMDDCQRFAQRLASYLPVDGSVDDQIAFCCQLKLNAWRMERQLSTPPTAAASGPAPTQSVTAEERKKAKNVHDNAIKRQKRAERNEAAAVAAAAQDLDALMVSAAKAV